MKKPKQPSQRDILNTLRESLVNPRQPQGLIQFVLEIQDSNYLIQRAIELLREPSVKNVTLAISLLAIWKVRNGSPKDSKLPKRTRSKDTGGDSQVPESEGVVRP